MPPIVQIEHTTSVTLLYVTSAYRLTSQATQIPLKTVTASEHTPSEMPSLPVTS